MIAIDHNPPAEPTPEPVEGQPEAPPPEGEQPEKPKEEVKEPEPLIPPQIYIDDVVRNPKIK